ncbi:hypothetical protein FB45DRAFT_1038416 [Roridomyces roridus]|uniref:Uncharacterized protein n=1 Tax=Roridomyces roridus TaxID=1738132 RepID=A0AAD7B448_9AGAR|nr:hypothetical protein FB45DRAFT_1038416 [Roridomyces roridus]
MLYLSSQRASLETCVAILHCTPQLFKLRLSFVYSAPNGLPPPSPPITKRLVLWRLSTLSFQSALCSGILEHLTLPALQIFTTDMDDVGGHAQLLSFTQLVARSNCVLRALTLDMTFMTNEEGIFNEWIQNGALQSLRVLTLQRPGPRDRSQFTEFLNLLVSNQPPLLPSLESLRVEGCDFHVRLPHLVRMLSARRAGNNDLVALQSFDLSFEEDGDDPAYSSGHIGVLEEPELEDALLELRRLREGGLRVDIQSNAEFYTGNVNVALLQVFAGHDLPVCGLSFLVNPGFHTRLREDSE